MADVMVLAIFMSFVAFNGLIGSAMGELSGAVGQLAIPTSSSKILPGYYLFIGFCVASMFLSKKLERGIASGRASPLTQRTMQPGAAGSQRDLGAPGPAPGAMR